VIPTWRVVPDLLERLGGGGGVTRALTRPPEPRDGIVVYRYRDRADMLGSWKSARNVAWPLREGEPPDGAGPAEVKPAA